MTVTNANTNVMLTKGQYGWYINPDTHERYWRCGAYATTRCQWCHGWIESTDPSINQGYSWYEIGTCKTMCEQSPKAYGYHYPHSPDPRERDFYGKGSVIKVCGCKRHGDPNALCTCLCQNHMEARSEQERRKERVHRGRARSEAARKVFDG